MGDRDNAGDGLSTAPAGILGDRGGGKRPYAPPCIKRLGGTSRGTDGGAWLQHTENQTSTGVCGSIS